MLVGMGNTTTPGSGQGVGGGANGRSRASELILFFTLNVSIGSSSGGVVFAALGICSPMSPVVHLLNCYPMTPHVHRWCAAPVWLCPAAVCPRPSCPT